ncbi:hypothetical protein Alide_1245 [Alicycliphilus denitrificans BC]|nr:hypothetical protein Alide_1245 [Alicycliphilus denitrificans BC]
MSSRNTSRRSTAAQPRTLEAQALHDAHQGHAARLAAIKRMASKLRMLDAYMPAVRAAGITVRGDELNCWGGLAIYVSGPMFNAQRNATLEKVLREQGMRETRRKENADGSYTVDLKKGHLTVCITVEAHRLPKPQEAAPCA